MLTSISYTPITKAGRRWKLVWVALIFGFTETAATFSLAVGYPWWWVGFGIALAILVAGGVGYLVVDTVNSRLAARATGGKEWLCPWCEYQSGSKDDQAPAFQCPECGKTVSVEELKAYWRVSGI